MELLVEQRKTIENEVFRFQESERTLYSSIRSCKDKSTMLDMVLDAIKDLLLKANFAMADFESDNVTKVDGYAFRVYNGKYWEHAGSYDIRDAIVKYIRIQGLVSVFSLSQANLMVHNMVVSTLRMKILHPRLTLMCFKNGVVDFGNLNTRPFLRKHNSKYDVVKMYDFKYDPLAYVDSRLWRDFIGEPYHMTKNENAVLPEDDKRRQLQIFLGSLLIPREVAKFEYFMILQGGGGNGKSVIFSVLESIFGKDEVCSLDISQFSRPGDEKLRAMASLVGKRLLYCPEEMIKSFKHIKNLKSIISGEPQQYRRVGGNIDTMPTTPIVMFNTNKRWNTEDLIPSDDTRDDSMSRRAQILNFDRTVPVNARDTELSKKLEKERSGIFAWIVRGYMMLRLNKFRMPENIAGRLEVILAKACGYMHTAEGRRVLNSIALWTQRSMIEPYPNENSVKILICTSTLYAHYVRFCTNQGIEPTNARRFGRDMVALGYEHKLVSGYAAGVAKEDGGKNHYFVYCSNPKLKKTAPEFLNRRFCAIVPNLVDEADCELFNGVESPEEEYQKLMRGAGNAIEEEE